MRLRFAIVALLAISPALAHAESTSDLKSGRTIITSDGKRVGPIDRIVADNSGAPQSAAVIFDSRFIYIPASTLTPGDNGRVTTSLTYKDLRKLQ